jgi:integrase
LYTKRKNESRIGVKLPDTLRRQRSVLFSELCDDADRSFRLGHEGYKNEKIRIRQLKEQFGEKPADAIAVGDIRSYLEGQGWKPGTANRMRTVCFGVFKLGIENGKVRCNPVQELKPKKVSDDRVRFLNQFPPLATDVDYLKPHQTEEARLRAVIEREYPQHLEEFVIALNTGMRCKEQFVRLDWSCVDLARKDLYVPPSKNGKARHIPLNNAALAAFEALRQNSFGKGAVPIRPSGPVFLSRSKKRLESDRHWFPKAVRQAGLADFTWHDLRHSFASRLVMTDANIRTVADLLGHKTLAMTMRYSHISAEHKVIAVERLNRYNV